jgi:hypothetical protein
MYINLPFRASSCLPSCINLRPRTSPSLNVVGCDDDDDDDPCASPDPDPDADVAEEEEDRAIIL